MKTLLIFSNPFGNGPAGKAVSVGKYIANNSNDCRVVMCGGTDLQSMIENTISFIPVDERDETAILKVLDSIDGPTYVLSSQNRFAIKAAKARHVPCAFLDGLAWFWKKIPDDHLLADIIFWLNYPDIHQKIPTVFKYTIHVIHGIIDHTLPKDTVRGNEILLYLGGCKNPLTALPTHYLDLSAHIIDFAITNGITFDISTDSDSRKYLTNHPKVADTLHQYTHSDFILKLSNVRKFVTNGGQTAILEAADTQTPLSFFLPINLSQYALISKLQTPTSPNCLLWQNYVEIPKNFLEHNEKDAVTFFNTQSHTILQDVEMLNQVCRDFLDILLQKNSKKTVTPTSNLLENLGSSGAQDIYAILKATWGV